MGFYRKKPVVIEAIRLENISPREVADFIGASQLDYRNGSSIVISTLEGDMVASPGDWIIKGVKGELYPCKPDIFAATYEDVEGHPTHTPRSMRN